MQVSHSNNTKIPKKGNIKSAAKGLEGNHQNTLQIQRCRNHRRTYDAGSCTSFAKHSVKKSVASFMEYLKGKSALMMFDKHANLKYKFGNRHFWSEGYYVSTVGLNEATIKKYIQDQEKHDIALDKLSVKEYEDPFRDSK